MPKVLRIINRFNLGGPVYNVAYLTKYLSKNFETLLVGGAKDATEDSSEYIVTNLEITPTIIAEMKRAISPIDDYIAYKKIKKIILEFKPDIVHTHASKAGTLGRLAAAACNVPVVVHTFHGHVFHSYFGKLKTSIYKNIERYLAKKTNCIIAISEKQKQELAEAYSICKPEKIKVIPLGFDLQKFQDKQIEKRNSFRTKYNIADDEIVIIIVGRLVPIKNHILFLKALKFVQENTNNKIRAFIIGDGEERATIEAQAKQLDIDFVDATKTTKTALLTFTSWVKDTDSVYAGADIVTLTSFNEGTPVSLIEAQAANKAIVSVNVGGIEDVVLINQTALLSANDDLQAFSNNLLLCVEDEELRKKMSQKGWEHVKNKFHYTRLVNDMNNLYVELLEQKNKKS